MADKKVSDAVLTLEKVVAQKIRTKKKELAQWRVQREEAARNEEQCLRDVSEMELAIAVFRRAIGLEAEAPSTDELDLLRLRSQTIAESCLDIMRRSGGRSRVTEIVKLLFQAGKLKNRRTGYATVTKTLDRDERFRRVGRGEFEIGTTPGAD